MSVEPSKAVVVEALLSDSYDGAIRLLGDAQRFGFDLVSFALDAAKGEGSSATFILQIPACLDVQVVAARFARHPAVEHVAVRATQAPLASGHERLQPLGTLPHDIPSHPAYVPPPRPVRGVTSHPLG